MPHAYNLAAFDAGRSTASPLLNLYCSLIILELGLKDARFATSAKWDAGHDVPAWVAEIADPILNSLAVQLSNTLGSLRCTLRDGNSGPVNSQRYPDVRYLRHESDYAGETTDNGLQAAITIAKDIEQELRKRGLLI